MNTLTVCRVKSVADVNEVFVASLNKYTKIVGRVAKKDSEKFELPSIIEDLVIFLSEDATSKEKIIQSCVETLSQVNWLMQAVAEQDDDQAVIKLMLLSLLYGNALIYNNLDYSLIQVYFLWFLLQLLRE